MEEGFDMTAQAWPGGFTQLRELAPEVEFQLRSLRPSIRYVSPQLVEIPTRRRRYLDRKLPTTLAEWVEARDLYFQNGVEIWAVARMMHLSRKAVRQIIFPWPAE